MYASTVNDRKLTLQVSGMLWQSSLVMRDVETGSLWSHILGECKGGELLGAKLDVIPSTMATWKEWRTQYPGTQVLNLDRTASDYVRAIYDRPEHFVYGVIVADEPRAYPFEFLFERTVVQEEISGTPVLVVFEPESTMAFIYWRTLGDGPISFREQLIDGMLKDETTGSLWNPWTGRAIDGELEGQRLRHLNGIVSFRRAWGIFHPDSTYAE